MRHSRFLLLTLLSFSYSGAYCAESPASTVEKFYDWAIHRLDEGRGIASGRQYLGQELLSALEAQRNYETACSRLAPKDHVSYSLPGNPFFHGPDKVRALLTAKAVIKADTAHVGAQLTYGSASGGLPSVEGPWTDTVILRRKDNRWVILDIKWQDGESLTQRLVEFSGHPSVCAVEPRPGEGSN